MKLSIFGDKAKMMKKNQLYSVSFDSIEGRKVAYLQENHTVSVLLEMLDTGKITEKQVIQSLRAFTGDQSLV